MRSRLESFELLLQSLIEGSYKRPKAILCLFSLLFIVALFGASKLHQVVSIEDQLDSKLQSTKDLKALRNNFGSQSSFGFIVMAPKDGFTAADLCIVKRAINLIKKNHSEIKESFSLFDIRRAQIRENKLHYMPLIADVCLGDSNRIVDLSFIKESPWSQLISGPNLKDLAFNLSLDPLDPPGTYGTFNPELVKELIGDVKNLIPLETQITGTSAQEYFTMIGLSESQWLNILGILIIVCCFKWMFGTWKAGPLYFISVLYSAALVYGGMGWLGHPVDPLSICLFLMLAVASLEDFIFVTNQLPKSKNTIDAFKKVSMPCFFTSVTTILAFSSLGLSDLDSIKYFGLWAAFGACGEWLATFVLIPSILKCIPSLSSWNLKSKSKTHSTFTKILSKSPPKLISYLSLLIFASAFISIKNFKLTQTPTEMFPKDHPFQKTIDYLKDDRGWVAQASLVFSPKLSLNEKDQIRLKLKDRPILLRMESWEAVIDYIKPEHSYDLLDQMIVREVSISDLNSRYHSSMGEQKDILYLRSSNTTEVNKLRDEIGQICPNRECWIAGEFIGFADFSMGLIDTLFESLFMSMLLVGGVISLLALSYGNGRNLFGLLVSSFWGPAVMLTAIFACGISINFVTCVVASTLIGLTGDNAIMFIFQKDQDLDAGIQSMGLGSIQTALIMSLCSLTFIFSYFEPPQMLGILLAGGFLSAVVGDIWLLKGLIPHSSSVTDTSHST